MCALRERGIFAEDSPPPPPNPPHTHTFSLFCRSEGIWRRKRTPVPKITENASEHRADFIQSVCNCVSAEPCPPFMLWQSCTVSRDLALHERAEPFFGVFFLNPFSLSCSIIFGIYYVFGAIVFRFMQHLYLQELKLSLCVCELILASSLGPFPAGTLTLSGPADLSGSRARS